MHWAHPLTIKNSKQSTENRKTKEGIKNPGLQGLNNEMVSSPSCLLILIHHPICSLPSVLCKLIFYYIRRMEKILNLF